MKKYIETSVLRDEYLSIFEKIDKIEDNDEVCFLEKRADDIAQILMQRYRAAIYKVACRILRNGSRNQFSAAADFADGAIEEVCTCSYHYEIGALYTKTGCPVVVDF